MKKILITGANGFIGSFLVEKALASGYETWAGVRKSSNLQYLQDERIKFIDIQYNDIPALKKQLERLKPDYIIHNAGITKCTKIEDFDRINHQYTVNLAEAIKLSTISIKKFILMSSLSAYGTGDEENYTPIEISDTPKPNTAYGKSKLNAEQYLQSKADFPYIIFRPTGVYGPREKDYLMMLKTVKAGFNISAGFKPQHLTFIYVKDLVDIVFIGLDSKISDRSYFVSDGNVYTTQEYARLIKHILNKNKTIKITIPLSVIRIISYISEAIAKLTKRPSTLNRDKFIIMKQRNWKCNIQPLIDDLGFAPQYNLQQGLKESIEWYKANGWF